MQLPSEGQLRRSAAVRIAVAVAVAGAASALAVIALWGPLAVRTNIVGYPIWANFNPYNYFRLYYFAVVLFPSGALLLFLGMTRLGARIGLPTPLSRGNLRPGARPPRPRSALDSDPPLGPPRLIKQRAIAIARLAFVGLVLGLEGGIATNHLGRGLMLGAAIYMVAVAAAVAVLERWTSGDCSLEERLNSVNAVGASLTVAGLIAVSASTEVRVLADGSVQHYPWFPAWLGMPIAAALIGWTTVALRRASLSSAAAIERRALILIAAPVALFLLLAFLPGDSATIETFESGQPLVAARLVGDGWLPWRDVVVVHGLLRDLVAPVISLSVFGNSYWGLQAGGSMLLAPLYLVVSYFLSVYLFGRNVYFLLLAGMIDLGTVFAVPDFRFILWPLILLLLAAVLNRPTRLRAVGLGLLLVAQAIVTPEAVPALPAVALILVAYEWYWRPPATTIVSAFRRSLWFAGAGAALAIAFAIYMASQRALDDYLYITVNLIRGHVLLGAVPPDPGTPQFEIFALAPPIGLLISFTYAIARVRLRRPFSTADWVMGADALFLLAYYPKFLSRMDTGHAGQPFELALPLLLYIVYLAVNALERLMRGRRPANRVIRLTAHPVSIGLAVLLAALTWGNLRDRIENATSRYRPQVAAQPEFKRVGYTQAIDNAAYRDLRRVIAAYLSPRDRLYDFTDSAALFFYFMDRDPSTRYFLAASLVDTPVLQEDTIRRLRQSPPKLIVFENDSLGFIGLSNMDGVPTMVRLYEISQWILDRYRPLLRTHGFTIYARRGMPPLSKVGLHLSTPPITRGVALSVQPCTWGSAPSFLSRPAVPGPRATRVGARARTAPDTVTVIGWAGDPKAKQPASKLIATVDGKVVGRTEPRLSRPDLVAYGLPKGFQQAGFQMQVPVARGARVRVFGVSQTGQLTEIVAQDRRPAHGTTRIGNRSVKLTPNAVWGQLNTTTHAHVVQIERPASTPWTDYRWLEVDAGPRGFHKGDFTVYDRRTRPSMGREISFQTLDDSPRRYIVPVASCSQWHAYRGRRLFINQDTPQHISAVRLIR